MTRYRLKLKRLDFVSVVDDPAQETAKVLLIKRRQVDGVAHVAKIADELGLVFCWAFTSKAAGEDYFDLHGDTIDQDFIKAAAEFMESGGAVDEMHDGEQNGRVVFAMPMTPDVAKAFGIETDTVGLMVALRPSVEALAKFKSGEYTGVSIAGIGERELVTSKSTSAVQARKVNPMADEQPKTPSIDERMDALEKLVAGIAEKLAAKAEEPKEPKELPMDEEAAKSVDPVVYKCADGTAIHKSAGDVAVAMAKRADAAEKVAKSERDARELVELTKAAGETIPNLGGAMDVKVQLFKAAKAIGPAAIEMLKGADAAFASAMVAKGAGGGEPKHETPQAELDALVTKHATEHKVSKAAATSVVLTTTEGRALYAKAEHARQIANLNLTPTAPQA